MKGPLDRWARRAIGALVGDANPEKSLAALAWGWSVTLVLRVAGDFIYFAAIYDGPSGPALNTSVPVLKAEIVATIAAVYIGSFLAATLAPAHPVRHAIVAALPLYAGSLLGIPVHWHDVPWSRYVLIALVSVATAYAAGAVQRRLWRPNDG